MFALTCNQKVLLFVNWGRKILSNVTEFCMRLIVFHGKNEIEKSEKCTKKRDSRREKRDLDFSLSLHVPILSFSHPFVFRPMGSPLLELSTSGWVIFYLSLTGTLNQCLFIYTTLHLALTSYYALSDMNGSSGLS